MALTKAKIAQSIEHQLEFSKKESVDLLEELLEIIKRTLASGEDIMVSGFGKFCIREKKLRKGRNPATGKQMMLDARRVATFRWSGALRNRVNGDS